MANQKRFQLTSYALNFLLFLCILHLLTHSHKKMPRRRGQGFLSDIGNAFKKVHDVVKQSGAIGTLVPGPAGTIAKNLGYGRRRRKRRVGGKHPAIVRQGMGRNKLQPYLPDAVILTN